MPFVASYLVGAFTPDTLPPPSLPEIVVVGRSNVGKSSLINALANQKRLAKVSTTPGRTQALHFFEFRDPRYNERFILVDVPGLGYAQVPDAVRKTFEPLLFGYLAKRPTLKLLVLLVDGRRDPGKEEGKVLDAAFARKLPLIVVQTKIDQVPKPQRQSRHDKLAHQLGLPGDAIHAVSTLDGTGVQQLEYLLGDHVRHLASQAAARPRRAPVESERAPADITQRTRQPQPTHTSPATQEEVDT